MSDKPVFQKLQIKPGSRVVIINPPPGYHSTLGTLPAGVRPLPEPEEPVDIIQVFVANRQELEDQLPRLKAFLKPGGMLWVTYIKGTSKLKTDIHRDSINAYAKTLGLEGVAMVSIDADWSALRLKQVA